MRPSALPSLAPTLAPSMPPLPGAPTAASPTYAIATQGATRAMVTDPNGGAVVAGQMGANLNFGGRSVTHKGKGDAWAARIDPSGRVVWMQMWGGTEMDEGRAVAVDADSVYVAGVFQSLSMLAGSTSLTGSFVNTTDIFLVRLNGTTGDVMWARAFGTEAVEAAVSLAVTESGVLMAGTFQGASLALDAATTLSNPNAPAGNSSFLATFGPTGSLVSATAYADMTTLSRMIRDPRTGALYFIGTDYVARLGSWRASLAGSSVVDTRRAIAVDPTSRYVFVGGTFTNSSLVLGATTLRNGQTNGGSPDGYLARMDAATGEFQWARRFVGGGAEIVLGLAVDASSVYVGGKSAGSM